MCNRIQEIWATVKKIDSPLNSNPCRCAAQVARSLLLFQSMKSRNIRILGTGKYLPRRQVTGAELDRKLGLAEGSTTRISGVEVRHFASEDELNSVMGAHACMAALENAQLKYEDIDAIVYVSGSVEQIIPCTAALVQKRLGKENSGTPCFDINATCLSFVTGLDVMSYLVDAGRYRKILLVSAEIASFGLNWKHLEAASLFGDGAAAVIIGKSPEGETSHILSSAMETYSSGSDTCRIEGGGSRLHAKHHLPGQEDERFLFAMDGRKAFKMAAEKIPAFLDRLFLGTSVTLKDVKLVVPHQASLSGMELLRRRIEVEKERWMTILPNHGNCIAASIPMALHTAIEQKRITRGDLILLVGTSAGFSMGGVLLEY